MWTVGWRLKALCIPASRIHAWPGLAPHAWPLAMSEPAGDLSPGDPRNINKGLFLALATASPGRSTN